MAKNAKKKPLNKKLFTIAATIGVAVGIVSLLYVILLYFLDEHPFGRFQYVVIALQAVLFAIGFVTFRDKHNGYRLSFREAIFLGFGISSIATLVYAICIFLFLSFTTSGQNSLQVYKDELFAMNEAGRKERPDFITEEVYLGIKKNVEAITPTDMTLKEFRFSLGAGALLTIMMTIIFRHNPK